VLEKYVDMGAIRSMVPDVGAVLSAIATCRDRIHRETERLKVAGRASGKLRPEPKKFVPRAQLPRR